MKNWLKINLGLIVVGVMSWFATNFFLSIYPLLLNQPKFLLALPVIFAFLLLMLLQPEFALIVILLIRPILDSTLEGTRLGGSGGIGIGAGFNLAIILLLVIYLFKNQGLPKNCPFNRWWIIFLLAVLPSVCFSPFLSRAVRLYLNFVTYFAMALLPFLLIKTKADYDKYLKLLQGVILIPLAIGLADLLSGGRFMTMDAGRRVVGPFTHPNIMAFFLVLGIVIYFCSSLSHQSIFGKKSHFWPMVLGLIIFAVIFGTKARSAWIASFLVFLTYGLLKDRRVLIYLLLLTIAACFVPQVQERVVTLLSERGGPGEYQGENSFIWRIHAWQTAMTQIIKNPIAGYGLTSFVPLSRNFAEGGVIFAMHNIYLELWFETGIFGMLSYFVLLVAPLWQFIKLFRSHASGLTRSISATLIGYTVGYLLISFSDNLAYYLAFNWYYWFFVSLMLVGIKLEQTAESSHIARPA